MQACSVYPKNRPTLNNKPTSLLNETIAKGAFLLKVCQPVYAVVLEVMSRSSGLKEVGPANEGRFIATTLAMCLTRKAL